MSFSHKVHISKTLEKPYHENRKKILYQTGTWRSRIDMKSLELWSNPFLCLILIKNVLYRVDLVKYDISFY